VIRRATILKSLFALIVLVTAAGGPAGSKISGLDTAILEIATRNGVQVFSVEVANKDEDRARGLMFRRELPERHGMLFQFDGEENVSMWMRNTYIRLDMIFIKGDGQIRRIAENTEPLSERVIPSGGPVSAVLEVAGGTASKLGIAPGDRVGPPIFARN
jgi:uncharacterized membrane protein (UPF0127 family)